MECHVEEHAWQCTAHTSQSYISLSFQQSLHPSLHLWDTCLSESFSVTVPPTLLLTDLPAQHKHSLTHTHLAHQAHSWIFIGSLAHLPQGHQSAPVHSEATSATLAPQYGSHTCITVQGANYGWLASTCCGGERRLLLKQRTTENQPPPYTRTPLQRAKWAN